MPSFRKQAKWPMSLVMSSELLSFKRISLKFVDAGSYWVEILLPDPNSRSARSGLSINIEAFFTSCQRNLPYVALHKQFHWTDQELKLHVIWIIYSVSCPYEIFFSKRFTLPLYCSRGPSFQTYVSEILVCCEQEGWHTCLYITVKWCL